MHVCKGKLGCLTSRHVQRAPEAMVKKRVTESYAVTNFHVERPSKGIQLLNIKCSKCGADVLVVTRSVKRLLVETIFWILFIIAYLGIGIPFLLKMENLSDWIKCIYNLLGFFIIAGLFMYVWDYLKFDSLSFRKESHGDHKLLELW